MTEPVGRIQSIWRFPIKSFQGESVERTSLSPGGIRTPAIEDYFERVPAAREASIATHAMRRLGEPEEIADAVAWLCSDRASFVTGHVMVADGGVLVNPHTL